MSEADSLLSLLRQSVASDIVAAIEDLIRNAPDRELNRINALNFAARRGLDEERVIAGFLHATRIGLFDLSWNVLCPGCGGVLDAGTSLKSLVHEEYDCALCAAGYEPTLDEMVEVTFTVTRRARSIAAHDPDQLHFAEYCRQIFWSSGVDLPEEFAQLFEEVPLAAAELPPGGRASRHGSGRPLPSPLTRCERRPARRRCGRARCASRSRTTAMFGCSRASGSRRKSFTRFWASAGLSSRQSVS